jgi:hypothetical protein
VTTSLPLGEVASSICGLTARMNILKRRGRSEMKRTVLGSRHYRGQEPTRSARSDAHMRSVGEAPDNIIAGISHLALGIKGSIPPIPVRVNVKQ